MDYRLLGPLEVEIDGRTVGFSGLRQRRLLGALLLEADRVVPEDRLVQIVWHGEDTPEAAIRTMRTYVTRIRQALGETDTIVSRDAGYVVPLNGHVLDARAFEDMVLRSADLSDSAARVDLLTDALKLWRGPLLGELAQEPWVLAEHRRLDELRAVAAERRADAKLDLGLDVEVVADLEGDLAAWPTRDRLRGLHMLALYRSGREADALRSFQQHRHELVELAGLEPGDELRELEQRIVSRDPALDRSAATRQVRGYSLGDVIGEGAFSLVYRGTQPAVGREVAVKQIRAELANRPDFVRRFEEEAQMVARLEHPYIVPLYDYWREPDTAFLVMRWLRGGTLEGRVRQGRLDLEESLEMVRQVGSALAAAHRVGIVHRDVKPANVFLDEQGNFFLGDFGIAFAAEVAPDPSAALSAGSPAYASPEQLRREPVGPGADVHGLGITLFESLTGHLPFPAEPTQAALLQRQLHEPIPLVRSIRTDVPAGIDDVIQRATAKAPSDRYASVGDFVDAYEHALEGGSAIDLRRRGSETAIPDLVADNPYRGLRVFSAADAAQFFGRERLVDELVAGLQADGSRSRLVTLVGPSGSGKSSVVRAGLVPALRDGVIPGSDAWFATTMTPGSAPFEELEASLLRVAVNPPERLLSQLTEDQRGFGRAVKRILPDPDAELLLVIDQFEELFTLCDDTDVRRSFLHGIASAVTDNGSQVRVVLTVRADFYDRPLRHAEVAGLIKASTVVVAPLAPDELEQAIVHPALQVGCEFEPGLVSEIVADVADQPGALPLLQYALTELWERRVSSLLTRDAYRDLGGVTGAVAARAEELFQEAGADTQADIRRLFSRLVTIGDGGEDTRRRVVRSELVPSQSIDTVIDSYGSARLLSFDRDPQSREPTVEVAHEALIREWPRLRGWLDDDRDGLRVHRHLTDASHEWDERRRDDGELYRGARLGLAREWAVDHSAALNPLEAAFLDASAAQADAEEERERRRVRRLRRLLGAVAVIAVVAMVAGLVALRERNNANDAVAREEIRRLIADSANQIETDRRLALLMALEAHRLDPSVDSLGSIQRILTQVPTNWLGSLGGANSYSSVELLPPDQLLAAGPQGVDVYSLDSRRIVRTIPFEEEADQDQLAIVSGSTLEASADGSRVLATFVTGEWIVFDPSTGSVVRSSVADGAIVSAAITSDGSQVFIGREGESGNVVERLDVDTGQLSWSQPFDQPTRIVTLTEDDAYLAVLHGNGQPGSVWDARTGAVVVETIAGDDRRFLAEAEWRGRDLLMVDELPRLLDPFDPDAQAVDVQAAGVGFGRGAVDLKPDGSGVVVVGSVVHLIGAETSALEVLPATMQLGGGVEDAAYDPERAVVAVVGATGIELVSTLGRGVLVTDTLDLAGPPSISEDGRTLIGYSTRGEQATAWDLTADAPMLVEDLDGFVRAKAGPGGFVLVTGTDPPAAAAVWDGDTMTDLALDFATPATSSISPDGRLVAIGSFGTGGIHVFDRQSGEHIVDLDAVSSLTPAGAVELGSYATDLEFTPDSSELIATLRVGGAVRVYDTATWEPSRPDIGSEDGFHGIDFASDGSYALTFHREHGIALRDPETLEVLVGPIAFVNDFMNGGQNPDILAGDRYALFSSTSEGVFVLDTETMELVGDAIPNESPFNVEPAVATEAKLVAARSGGRTLVWNVDVATYPELACRAAGRNMTEEEWELFGPDGEYRETCPTS